MTSLDATFAALADPTRRQVVSLLRVRPRRAGALAKALGLRPPAMSRHLRVLRDSGLVEDDRQERDARVRVFKLRPEPFGELRAWIEDVERYWSGQLAAFKAHVEKKHGR